MNISISDAILISISGVITVFLVLSIISLLVIIISKILNSREKKEIVKTPVSEPVSQVGQTSGNVSLIDVDEKTAACIMAIVSHETKIPLNQLIFKQIKGGENI